MGARALVLGLVLGFAAATFQGCPKTATCSPSNCSGCCDSDGRCVERISDEACGTQGGACANCAAQGGTCSGGTCALPLQGKACGPTTCPSGCCADTGPGGEPVCVPLPSNQLCGIQGAKCAACNTAGGELCIDGACTVSRVTGRPCTQDSECISLGAGTSCRKTTQAGVGTYPGGFCTKQCSAENQCPGDAFCVRLWLSSDEAQPLCLNKCDNASGCRKGYTCYPLSNGAGVCWIFPPVEAIAEKVGDSCANNAACQPPADGFCIQDTLTDGGPSGYHQGSCSALCTGEPERCSRDGGSICLDTGTSSGGLIGVCYRSCQGAKLGQRNCRTNYVCESYLVPQDDGGIGESTDGGYCVPNCNVPGNTCPADAGTCMADGYCK